MFEIFDLGYLGSSEIFGAGEAVVPPVIGDQQGFGPNYKDGWEVFGGVIDSGEVIIGTITAAHMFVLEPRDSLITL